MEKGGGSIQGRMKTLILKIIWMRKMRMRKTQTTTPRYWKIMLKESLVVRGEEAALNLVLNKTKTHSHKSRQKSVSGQEVSSSQAVAKEVKKTLLH